MLEEVDLDTLNDFHPKLRPYIKVLLTHEFGLLKDPPKIHSVQCGRIVTKSEIPRGDRFQLRILYCRKPINWHVLMDGENLKKSPDFVMEENFLADATPELIQSKVPSWANWNPSDVNCLLNVFLELLKLYKSYQINLLKINQNLQRYLFEYDTLVSMAGIAEDDVEVCVQNAVRNVIVIFLIHLNVDFSKLPTALPNCKDLTVLFVEFKDNAKNTVQLMPRIELEDAFGGPLELPDLSPDMSLMDYVPLLEELLQNKMEKIIEHNHHRKMLYSYLIQFFEPSLINGDNINFKNVSFLLELDGFYCVLNVHIPLEYPDNRPTLQLFTLHKTLNLRASDFNGFRFNQNMTHEEVARSIFAFVKETAINELQKHIYI